MSTASHYGWDLHARRLFLDGALAEFHALFNVPARLDDRAIAILGATYPDILLEHLLAAFFVDDEREAKRLLKPDGPLGAFGARVSAACCLGLICRTVRDDLRLIGQIRNKFAHTLDASFDDDPIRAWCLDLRWHKFGMMMKPPAGATPRDIFQVGVNQVIANIIGRVGRAERRVSPNDDAGGPTLLR